ncbi:CPBP family intramembrane metalloprotease [soil metagenome]
MPSTDVSPTTAGLDIGARRFLHPGPLRWLRALGWGVLLFVVFSFFYGLLGLATDHVGMLDGTAIGTLVAALASVLALVLYARFVGWAEFRRASELGLKQAAPELLIGCLIGVGMMAVVVGALLISGLYEQSGPRAASPWGMITIGIMSGFFEELIFRAIVLRLLMRAFGIWPALALSAALFGALHLGNPNATAVAAIAIAVEAGLMLASFYLLTGRLWMSIGVHAAWNFAQGWIFGARVSGLPVTESLYLSTPKAGAPTWLSGGDFGPEASVPAMVVGTGAAIVVLYWAWKKGNFKALPDTPKIEAA